jgi:hypothetical protein
MGAKLKEILIADGVSDKDLRVSFTWIQNSRTGKGRMNKAFKKTFHGNTRFDGESNVSFSLTHGVVTRI